MSVEEILLKMLLFTLRIADVGTFFVTLVEIESFVHNVHIYQERQNLRVQGFPPLSSSHLPRGDLESPMLWQARLSFTCSLVT